MRSMHKRTARRSLIGGVLAGLLIGGAAVGTAPADAMPGDPAPGCESMTMFVTTLYCDGPIRPDGSWKRCWSWPGSMIGGFYQSAGTSCAINTPENIQPLVGPKYHIPGAGA